MSKPVVCVVGRPNVGKSTLFNKIVGKRISITEDTPGVTRDRIYAEGNWLNHQFNMIDTGGLDLKDDDTFMKNIKMQVEIAIDHADVIIFVVDGVDGVTSADLEIASMLRKSGRKIVLAVNKLDTKGVDERLYEFYELGVGHPFMISAENSIGLGDMLDEVVSEFPAEDENAGESNKIRVAFIGKPNVGKSSMINKFLGEERLIVTNIPGTTRDSVDSDFIHNGVEYVFVDTAGMRKRKKIYENVERYSVIRSLSAIDRADVCIAVIDATEGISEQDTKIIGYAHDNGKALIVAVNKWDAVEKETNTAKQFEYRIREMLGFANYAQIEFVSALTGQRLFKLLDTVNTVYENYNRRVATGVLNDVINMAVLMNQAPSDKGRQGKIYYASQISTMPPKFLIFVNDIELIHFSYLRYLENQIRQNFNFSGTPIVMELRERSGE